MSNKEKVEVVIDSREDNAVADELTGLFIRHEDIKDAWLEELSSADIDIEGVGFERKTPSDFASSLMEGRLKDQARRMSEEYEHSYIVVEGSLAEFGKLRHTDIPAKSLRGAAASVTARYCPVLFVGDSANGELINRELLVDMCMRIARKHIEEEGRTFVKGAVSDTDLPPGERLAGSLEGVGPKLAERIHDRFGNAVALASASRSDLQTVEGVGEELAESIYTQLRET